MNAGPAALAAQLQQQIKQLSDKRVVAGFDGFVDELIEPIDERQSEDSYTTIESMQRFGEMIKAASGRSSLNEIEIRSIDAGGCAVNLSDALNHAGVPVDYFGTLGDPIHPAFQQFSEECHSCHSWLDGHGRTLALEFKDGKYMLASMSDLARFTPDLLAERLADGVFQQACSAADLIVMNNWTLYPHMTDCWQYLNQQVFSTLSQQPFLFIDLVNPSSRSDDDCRRMLETLTALNRHGRCILGLNLNEADIIAGLIGVDQADGDAAAVLQQCQAIREHLGMYEVVTHGVSINCVAGADYTADDVAGPYCAEPKKSTGAGDRFNAGYCLGLLLDVHPEQRLQLGVASSGFFIRHARSATAADLIAFLEGWQAGTLV